MPSNQPHPNEGFIDLCVRRVGEQPGRWFARLWLIMFLLSLPFALLGFSHLKMSAQPPAPEAIPYNEYMRGGWYADDIAIDVPTHEIPVYDESVSSHGLTMRPDPVTGEARLFAWAPHYVGLSGWPLPTLAWASHSMWDVTDPSQPFPLAAGAYSGETLTWHTSYVGLQWRRGAGSRSSAISIRLPGALLQIAVPLFLASLVTALLTGTFRIRRNLRRKAGRCLHCGHAHDPQRAASQCAECGLHPCDAAAGPSVTFMGRRWRAVAVAVALLVIAWLVVQGTARHVQHQQPLDQQLRARAKSGLTYTGKVEESITGWGWPLAILHVQRDHWFTFSPGEEAVRAASRVRRGIKFDKTHATITIVHRDPSVSTYVMIAWAQVVLQLSIFTAACMFAAAVINRASARGLAHASGDSPQSRRDCGVAPS